MYQFLSGAVMFGCFVAGAFFLQAYRRRADRLFALFALSFFILGIERLILAVDNQPESTSPLAYIPRLIAFGLIVAAVIEKNRALR